MKTTGRLTLFCFFAAAGVGLAVCVGTSANVSVVGGDSCRRAGSATPEIRRRESPPTIATAKPAGPVVVAPASLYAQEVVPPPESQPPANLLDLLQNNLTEPPQAVPPQAPTAQDRPSQPGATVAGLGDGRLRICIHDEDIRKVLDLLAEQGNLNILASKNVQGKVSATLNGVDIPAALGAILKSTGYVSRRDGDFIFVGTPDDFNNIEQAMDRVGTRTYRTNYITAAELKTLVEPLLTKQIGVVSISSASEVGVGSSDSAAGGNKFSGGEVLVVRDYEAILAQIDQLVSEVDVRPMQVAIEAMILNVKLEDTDKFGVNFQLLKNQPNLKFGLGSPAASLTDVTLDGGLKFGFLDSSLGAFLEALEKVGETNVVANPRLMVLNKQRAEIQVGKKQGYVSQTITETTSTQSVEFLDTGTQLRLRPFISSDGLIRMEVHPELSDGNVEVTEGFTLPNKTLTQTTTNIMVRDGCTVIIGGLIQEQLTNDTTQLPVLGNLPWVGFLFRQTTQKNERHEVIVLITPRIVYEPGSCHEGKQAECEFLRRQNTYADKMSPFGKRSIARRYFRLAETAYASGDRDKALRFAEMAVQFDPLNRAALDLRSDIWLNKPYRPQAVVAVAPSNSSPGGEALPDWVINDLEKTPAAASTMPSHPLDPGVPGRHRDLVRPKVMQ